MRKGKPLDQRIRERIIKMLKGSDMTSAEIAREMNVSRGSVYTLNKTAQVRPVNWRPFK